MLFYFSSLGSILGPFLIPALKRHTGDILTLINFIYFLAYLIFGVLFGNEPSLEKEEDYSRRYTLNLSHKDEIDNNDDGRNSLLLNKDILGVVDPDHPFNI